ncbi:MAG: hypothetical protein HN580_23320 [Deltaproteobacteria bacterium]|jgi:hypothetical protein|nr:hypothetical protein [Deltaproteobacteria bacterium]MBT4262676.1 hypothetical protein [Deltaproteobacteria bacterium]MBT4643221.1 hypothetical protein [Deltaproteobacteria bacterium]MBT6503760.1 hypothetical protein [Deltaproteobacteria bacterium]MBT6611751.1 hypothetical protein [Deltaproteobacteria bacterium]
MIEAQKHLNQIEELSQAFMFGWGNWDTFLTETEGKNYQPFSRAGRWSGLDSGIAPGIQRASFFLS